MYSENRQNRSSLSALVDKISDVIFIVPYLVREIKKYNLSPRYWNIFQHQVSDIFVRVYYFLGLPLVGICIVTSQ